MDPWWGKPVRRLSQQIVRYPGLKIREWHIPISLPGTRADDLNCKVSSTHYIIVPSRINAFAQGINCPPPPIKLISSTLRHMCLCNARGILLVPYWPSNYFWLLHHNESSFASFNKDHCIIYPYYYSSSEKCQFKGFMSSHAITYLAQFTNDL